jgi:hypothetical protein
MEEHGLGQCWLVTEFWPGYQPGYQLDYKQPISWFLIFLIMG